MASRKQAYNSVGTATITLASLGNGNGEAMTAVDNQTNVFMSADILVQIKTGPSGVSATGRIDLYLVRSADGSNFDDGFAGTDAAITVVNSKFLGSFAATANATVYKFNIDLYELGITLPRKWAIAVVNNSGAALDSTAGNHALKYTEKYETIA